MPCSDGGYPTPEPDPHNGPTAELLCHVMQEKEARGQMEGLNHAVLAWWDEHKARDRKRLQAQMARKKDEDERQAALALLSPHQRRLLGL